MCSFVINRRHLYRFEDKMFIFGWTIPLKLRFFTPLCHECVIIITVYLSPWPDKPCAPLSELIHIHSYALRLMDSNRRKNLTDVSKLNAGLKWFIVATFPQLFQMIVPAHRWLDLDRLCLPNRCYLLRFCVVIHDRAGSVDSLVIRLDSGNWVAWVTPVLNLWVRECKMAVHLRHT